MRAPESSLRRGSQLARAERAARISSGSSPAPTRQQAAQAEAHGHFVQASIEVIEQALFQAEIGLRAGEQVLHQSREPRTPPRELDHARCGWAQQEAALKNLPGQARAEFEVGGKILAQHAPVSLR